MKPATHLVAEPAAAPVVRRDCECGGACADCAREKRLGETAGVRLGARDDPLEREADRMADAVMAGGDLHPDPMEDERLHAGLDVVQRAPGEEDAAQREAEDEDEEETLRMKPADPRPTAGAALPAAVAAVADGGRPLAIAERAFFEPRFGRDLGHVRLHTDAAAANAARDIGARAFALRHHVAFAAGRYAPGSADGRRLLAHELAHTIQQSPVGAVVLRRDAAPAAAQVPDAAPPVTPGSERGDVQEMDFAFIFTGGAFGNAARAFIQRYYPEHEIVAARSFQAMFDTLYARMRASRRGGRDPHLRELVIVTHANAAGGLKIPLTRGTGRNPDGFFNLWSLRELQQDFRADLHRRFRSRRSEVVSDLFDESTSVVVRGCEFGQAPEALAALRTFFGGDAYVWAPTGYQGYESIPIGGDLLPTPEAAFDFLMEREYLPPELQPLDGESKREFIGRVFGLRGRIPATFFVMGREQYEELHRLMDRRRGMSRAAETTKEREDNVVPSVGEHWSLSAPGGLGRPIPELDALSLDELEARGRALMANYRPEIAYMLVRLRQAWERKGMEVLERCRGSNDPLCGLPPSDAFGDSNIVGPDAHRFPGPDRDAFELTDIELPPEPAEVTVFEEAPAPGGEALAEPAATGPEDAEVPRPARGGAATAPAATARGGGGRPARPLSGRAAATDFSKSQATRPQQPPERPDPQALIDALANEEDRRMAQAILDRMPEQGWQLSNYLSASELSINIATAPITFIEGGAMLFAIEAGGVVLGGLLSIAGLFATISESRETQIREHRVLGVRIGYERLLGELSGDRINGTADAARMREGLTGHPEVISAIRYNIPHAGRTALPAIETGVDAVAEDANRVLQAADAALRQALTEGGLSGADLEKAFEAARPVVRRRFINEMVRQGMAAIEERRRRIREMER